MKSLLLLCLLIPGVALSAPLPVKSVTLDGKNIRYQAKAFKPEIPVLADEKKMNQNSALNVARLLYKHLANGDVEAAAKISNAPEALRAKFNGFKEKLGGEQQFKAAFNDYFSGENKFVGEFIIGKHHLLVLRVKELDNQVASQYYIKLDGKYWVDEAPSEERDLLGMLFKAYTEGKLKIK